MVRANCKNCAEPFLQSGIHDIKDADPFCTECDENLKGTLKTFSSSFVPCDNILIIQDGQIAAKITNIKTEQQMEFLK